MAAQVSKGFKPAQAAPEPSTAMVPSITPTTAMPAAAAPNHAQQIQVAQAPAAAPSALVQVSLVKECLTE